ncbi:MAG: hypothetical protein ABFS05_05495 [Bacteroidota bacterium]
MKSLQMLVIASLLIYSSAYAQDPEKPTMADKRPNAIYVAQDFFLTLSINYERIFPLSEKIGLGLRGGFGNDMGNKSLAAIGEALFVYGRNKYFFEAGIGYHQPFTYFDEGPDPPMVALMAGYRYESDKGFLFKVYAEFIPDLFPEEGSWGHLPFIGFAMGYVF